MTPQEYAISMLHIPYLWGGKSPLTGLDCSGFVCEVLRAFGIIPLHSDFNAQQLYDHFNGRGLTTPLGALAFYGKSPKEVDHVALALSDNVHIIESASGDHTTTSLDIAKKQDARVKIRPIRYRSDFIISIAF